MTVSEQIEPASELNAEDSVDGDTATGAVAGGSDSYGFSGSLVKLVVDGDAAVTVDGAPLRRLVVERGPDSNGNVKYIIETTGTLVYGDRSAPREVDEIDGGTVFGRVRASTDEFWLLDGSVVDVSTFGGEVVTTLDGDVFDATD